MLNAVLREVKDNFGPGALDLVLGKLGDRAAAKYRTKLSASDTKGRVLELATLLRENGVEADVVVGAGDSIELREHNCPYAQTVAEHPEVCSIIHTRPARQRGRRGAAGRVDRNRRRCVPVRDHNLRCRGPRVA